MIYDVGNPAGMPPCAMRVFVDGKMIERVVYVDTISGIVRYHERPTNPLATRYTEKTITGKIILEPVK